MTVVVPADAVEAEKATLAIAATRRAYIRLAREKSPVITTDKTPFSLGKAQILRHGDDLTIVACGAMVYQALVAAETLSTSTTLRRSHQCGCHQTIRHHYHRRQCPQDRRRHDGGGGQAAGGLGGLVPKPWPTTTRCL
jgi:transketolase